MLEQLVYPVRSYGGRPSQSDGYACFAAMSKLGLVQHADPEFMLSLDSRRLLLRHRQPMELIKIIGSMPTALRVGSRMVLFDAARIEILNPSPTLQAFVTIKGKMCDQSHCEACEKQLKIMGIVGTVEVKQRGVVVVRRDTVIGYRTRITGLNKEHSLRLQTHGLGGRNHFGCGVFEPC